MTGIDEMSRITGQLEAGLRALEKAVEKGFDAVRGEIEMGNTKLESIDARLSHIEAKENQRKGAWALAAAIGAAVSGLVLKFGAVLAAMLGKVG